MGNAPNPPYARHRVVIVGGGFGGVRAAKALKRLPVDVTLIDRNNHHLFQPLLYQVATGVLSPGQVAPALRSLFRGQDNVRVLMGEVERFDLERKVVHAIAAARAGDPVRHADRRRRRDALVLRQRRLGRRRARDEDARRRQPRAQPDPVGVRAGRAGAGRRRARRAADVRRRRRRPDRCRAGRADRDPRAQNPQEGAPRDRPDRGARRAARRRSARAAAVPREAARARREGPHEARRRASS